ncbi:MAG: glucose-6-phosphate dehydrogenase [bacterium]|nr:glucose-6-phosphate dehydrogenase [bacterium]
MNLFRVTDPFVLSIFGASGDLARIKIFPALYELALQKRLPKKFSIFGYARTKKTNEEFRREFQHSVERAHPDVQRKILEPLLEKLFYFSGQYDDSKDFERFAKKVLKATAQKKLPHIAYLAVPPQLFFSITENLAGVQGKISSDFRVIIEKPFGDDEQSARELFHHVSRFFPEDKVYLLDHYLGKNGVLSLLPLRYANSILNTLLNGHLISNIQVTAVEDLSVDNRISYFDRTGIIKDMVQSHLLQILALITMDLPVEQSCSSIHREKFSILSALKIRGYEKAFALGQHESYRLIKGVKKSSKTATFAALRLFIDRQEWYRVPIYIRTGKMLQKKHTYIVIEFRPRRIQRNDERVQPNRMIIEMYPEEKIHFRLYTNVGGGKDQFRDITTTQSIACYGDDCLTEHGRLLLDVFKGDHCNFLNFEEIIATWRLTDKITKFAKEKKVPVTIYKKKSEGPEEQHLVPANDGFAWFDVPLEEK